MTTVTRLLRTRLLLVRLLVVRLLTCLGATSVAAAAPAPPMPASTRAVLEAYCLDCHDDTTRKARFSLESLLATPDDHIAIAGWTRVYDKLAAHEMPPADETQPTVAERHEVTGWLRKALHASSLFRQQNEGRVTLRRLNAREYEHTLLDLLGISVELKSLLPEDAMTAGFDTVSAGLDTSAAHLLRYQLAADKALAAAITPVPHTTTDRRTARQRWDQWFPADREDQRQSSRLHLHFSARLDGEALVFHEQTESNSFLEMEIGEPPVPGRYRLRARVSARNTEGKPLPVLFFRIGIPREFNVNNARIIAVRDAPAGTPAVIEEEITVTDDPHLGAGRRIGLKGWSLPVQKHPDDLRKDLAAGTPPDFSRPGLAVDWVELEGPIGGAPGYHVLFGDLPRGPRLHQNGPGQTTRPEPADEAGKDPPEPQSQDPYRDADRLIRSFLPAAFRRPVDEETAAPFVRFAHERLERGYPFAGAMIAAYRNILCSPRFLMLIEKPGPLDDHALASRLSAFLWSSRPDDALLARAATGRLHQPDVLRREVDRMLADPKAERFIASFTAQWLDLRHLHMTKPDTRYVEFDDHLLWSMPRETTAFFEEMLRHDRPASEFIASDWTFLDARLARHYGVPGVHSWEMQRTGLPASARRGGVMTHAAILKVTANGTTTSPILRGKWVLEKLLDQPPAPPPPDIPALEPDIRGATTIRQQLEKHRHLPACASCHVKIDPPGFALETYDVIGGWRDWYRAARDGQGGREQVALARYPEHQVWRGPDVEQGFTTPAGRPFRDIDEYRQILLEDEDQIARNLAAKLIIYATGAGIQFADREVIEEIVRETRPHRHGLRSILHCVVQSRCFLSK